MLGKPHGGNDNAKVLDGIDGGHESAQLMLSPSVRPCPLALVDHDRLVLRRPAAWHVSAPIGEHAMNEPIKIEY